MRRSLGSLQPGQSSNGSGGLLYRHNVGIPQVIDPSRLMSDFNADQKKIPYYPLLTNPGTSDPASANINLGDRSENEKE
ncbi:hypothetical protein SLEP1_g38619 [Rubroshorea leprosula]|uniref:Uncharacterized protein n=1 Tax=Rubroshorea leprosula TaxID=152421 RepID=A0AAV5KXN5_9ROSI|nr:hypothetical protein SLEP1_g38619 [Rubroshorea leprosula]